ncbi:potassium/proton antiporter [Hoyosella rhizosphaerae]|uniref:K+/H+ antiporter n=1 Tax=Hoyosella rhizosphaerae TaxID=1755582 RepID=A0A916X895_9ACTN|nr:potassium/proton antiporter [Hoyosella rhizosphaerae]MBN4927143.1 potassium/proton antiporter [Hoyosella rhizosphaerae]GGC53652.1 K+/H+ antiporter [Hoyosella rhizosphaerae]
MSIQLPADRWILAAALLLVAAILAAGFAQRIRMPGLLLFLGLGMLISDEGLGLVSLSDPEIAQMVGTAALLLILYEGGLTTKPRDIRKAAAPGLTLATVAVVITAAVLGGATYLILNVDLLTALLIGAVVASTDAAAVFAMLRRAPLPRKMSALLEVESGANDPMAIMLTVGLIATWTSSPPAGEWATFAVTQLGGGLLIGALVGLAGSRLLLVTTLGPAGVYPVLALGIAGLSYGLAAAGGASGFLAVYVAGLIVGAKVPLHRRGIRTFHEGLANTAEVALFLMLGMLVFPSNLIDVALPGLAIAAVLILVARPLAVVCCLIWFKFTWRELTFVSWVGLRGAVPIFLATFPAVAGYPDGNLIFNIVFFVVLVSALVQGMSIRTAAKWLDLTEKADVWSPVAEELPIGDLNAELVQVRVTTQLPIEGKYLSEVMPPVGLITAINRGPRLLIPTPRTKLREGDLVIVAMPRRPDANKIVTAWAKGELDPK